jgi:hypothetical protein
MVRRDNGAASDIDMASRVQSQKGERRQVAAAGHDDGGFSTPCLNESGGGSLDALAKPSDGFKAATRHLDSGREGHASTSQDAKVVGNPAKSIPRVSWSAPEESREPSERGTDAK